MASDRWRGPKTQFHEGLRILVAPAADRLDEVAKSEGAVMRDILRTIQRLDPEVEITALVDHAPNEWPDVESRGLRTLGVGGPGAQSVPVAAARRHVRIWHMALRRELVDWADIVHHALPFQIGRTFNLLPFVGPSYDKPFVVGPVQVPHTFVGTDETYGGGGWGRGDRLTHGIRSELLPLFEPASRPLSFATLHRANVVVAMTHSARDRLIGIGVPPVRIRVIPPPLPFDQTDLDLKHEHSEIGKLRLLYSGMLVQRKRVVLLVESVGELVRRGVDARLDIAGDGPEGNHVREVVRHLKLDGRVHLHGWLPQLSVAALAAQCDVFATMSESESFGQSMAEAMAAGIPAVSADNSGAREIIRDSQTGWILPASAAELRGAAITLFEHLAQCPEVRIASGLRARAWAAETVDRFRVAGQWLQVYKDAMCAVTPK